MVWVYIYFVDVEGLMNWRIWKMAFGFDELEDEYEVYNIL